MPREFVFMDRAAIGLGGVFLHLKAELNFFRLFNDEIEGFDRARLAARQAKALAAAGLQGAGPCLRAAPPQPLFGVFESGPGGRRLARCSEPPRRG